MNIVKISDNLYLDIREKGYMVLAQEHWKRDGNFAEIVLNISDIKNILELMENEQKKEDQ